jgi:hypothetical protein
VIPYDVDEAQIGALIAWEQSARDGSQTNVREHPVWLEPAVASSADTTTTSVVTATTLTPRMERYVLMQELRAEVRDLEKERRTIADARAMAADQAAIVGYDARLADLDRMINELLRPRLRAAVDEALADGEHWDHILDETCSGEEAARSLPDTGLDDHSIVVATWSDIHHAAVTCDWEGLADLLGDGFRYTFGEPGDPIEYWRYEEAIGYRPVYYLAEILQRPQTLFDPGTGDSHHVWPSAFAFEWSDVPEADRRALTPLYGEAALQDFAEFGAYIGYRVGIDADTGEWLFFLEGD